MTPTRYPPFMALWLARTVVALLALTSLFVPDLHHPRVAPRVALGPVEQRVVPLRADRSRLGVDATTLPAKDGHDRASGSRAVPAPLLRRHTESFAIRLSVTAYCGTGHRTASGVWPRFGMAAGNRWPFGTVLDVPGWGSVTITDRIGWGSDLDLFTPSCSDARLWGRRELLVGVS